MIRALPARLGWLASLASLCRNFRFLICAIGTKTATSGLRLSVSLHRQSPPLFCPVGSDLVWLFPSFWAFYPHCPWIHSASRSSLFFPQGFLQLLSLLVGLLLHQVILQLQFSLLCLRYLREPFCRPHPHPKHSHVQLSSYLLPSPVIIVSFLLYMNAGS